MIRRAAGSDTRRTSQNPGEAPWARTSQAVTRLRNRVRRIALLPVFAQRGAWGRQHLSPSRELSIRARLLEEGGPAMWTRFMAELHREHVLAEVVPYDGSVLATLTEAYLTEMRRADAG